MPPGFRLPPAPRQVPAAMYGFTIPRRVTWRARPLRVGADLPCPSVQLTLPANPKV